MCDPDTRRMIARRGVIAASLALAVWGLAAAVAWIRTPDGPRIELPDRPLHLGEGRPSQTLTGTFDVWNIGSEPLLYSIASSCGCTQLTPRFGKIPPGEQTTFEVSVKLDAKAGSQRDVRLTFQSNDRENSLADYFVSASCPDSLHLTPSSVDFGRVVEGTSASRTITIRSREDEMLPAAAPLQVRLEGDNFRSEAAADGSAYDITLLPSAPLGYAQGRLILTLGDAPPVVVPLRAEIAGEVNVAPATMRLKPGREQTLFVWRTDGAALGELVRREVPAGVEVQSLLPPAENRRQMQRFAVSLSAGAALREGSSLRLEFASLGAPVVLELVGAAESGSAGE